MSYVNKTRRPNGRSFGALRVRSAARRLAVPGAAMLALVGCSGAEVVAAEGNTPAAAQIESVSTSKTGEVSARIRYPLGAADSDVSVSVDDEQQVDSQVAAADPGGAMVVVDNAQANGNRMVQAAMAATRQLAESGSFATLGAVITSPKVELASEPTADSQTLANNIGAAGLAVRPGAQLWDALKLAADRLGSQPKPRSAVVIVAQPDAGSATNREAAGSALRAEGIELHVIDLSPEGSPSLGWESMIEEVGGTYQRATSATLAARAETLTDALTRERVLSFAGSPAGSGAHRFRVTFDGRGSIESRYLPGANLTSPAALTVPTRSDSGLIPAFFGSTIVAVLGALLALIGVGGLVWAGLGLAVGNPDSMRRRLEVYGGEEDERGPAKGLRERVDQIADVLGGVAERRGVAAGLQLRLDRAGSRLRVGELLAINIAGPIVALALGIVFGNVLLGLVCAVILGLAPTTLLAQRERKRIIAFESQLPDALQLLAGTLRAGFSVSQAIAAVADDIGAPIGQELRRAVIESQLGRPLEDALDAVAIRVGSADLAFAAVAIRVQREIGGNLAEILDTVAHTIVERQRMQREVRALTAEGRASAWVLGALPLMLLGFMALTNRSYLAPLTHGIGLVIAASSILLMMVGFIWMNRIVDIEV